MKLKTWSGSIVETRDYPRFREFGRFCIYRAWLTGWLRFYCRKLIP